MFDLTIPDAPGNTLIESQFIVIANQILDGSNFFFNGTSPQNAGSPQKYILYFPEYNAISSGVIGMKTGEEIIIPEPTS
ncbi:hypothetical protein [Methanoregula sp.]|uniref:hypothetical protein n=1 Tax=Methanoregula sp. TaxID=2052170 RepID=UPI003C719776